MSPCTTAPPIARARAAGTATTASLRSGSVKRRGRRGSCRAATASTRLRNSGEALGRAERSSVASSGDSIGAHHPFQLLQRAAQPCRARAWTDPEHTRRGLPVELEHDSQRDDFAFCPGQLCERVLELGGKTFAEARPRHLAQLPHGVALLAAQPTGLRAKVIQRRRARSNVSTVRSSAREWSAVRYMR